MPIFQSFLEWSQVCHVLLEKLCQNTVSSDVNFLLVMMLKAFESINSAQDLKLSENGLNSRVFWHTDGCAACLLPLTEPENTHDALESYESQRSWIILSIGSNQVDKYPQKVTRVHQDTGLIEIAYFERVTDTVSKLVLHPPISAVIDEERIYCFLENF